MAFVAWGAQNPQAAPGFYIFAISNALLLYWVFVTCGIQRKLAPLYIYLSLGALFTPIKQATFIQSMPIMDKTAYYTALTVFGLSLTVKVTFLTLSCFLLYQNHQLRKEKQA